MKKYLIISTATDLVRVAPEKIVYISSDGNYSTLVLANDETRVLTLQLGQVERLIESQLGKEGNTFIRIGRSHIINRSYIYYINVSRQKLVLSDNDRFSHMLNPSKEALGQLKELLERDLR
jgi:DNA-binding LytR/AlgR family response regulator